MLAKDWEPYGNMAEVERLITFTIANGGGTFTIPLVDLSYTEESE